MQIPRAVQHEIIRNLLAGQTPAGYTLEQIGGMFSSFAPEWYALLSDLLKAMKMEDAVERRAYLEAAEAHLLDEGKRERLHLREDFREEIRSLAELSVPDIEWLWPHWIPRGMLTVFGAMPSAGKSYVALDLAARITAGTCFPDGQPVGGRGTVIYVDAENVPQIHAARARAWGMDQTRLFLMGPHRERLVIDFNDDYDQDRLATWTREKRPEMIVIDSLSAVSLRGEQAVEEVRLILTFFNWIARDNHCGMVLIHHLRKPGAQLPLPKFLTFHDLRGSSHIAAMARSILGLHWVQTGEKQDLNSPRLLEILKTNLCQYPKPVGVTFSPMETAPDVAEIQYGEAPAPYEKPMKKVECAEWLLALLEERGELTSAEVIELAEEEGFRQATVYRARRELGELVVDTRGKRNRKNKWMLNLDETDEERVGEDDEPAT